MALIGELLVTQAKRARRGGAARGRRRARRRGPARAGRADLGALDPRAGARPRRRSGSSTSRSRSAARRSDPGDAVVLDADGVVVVARGAHRRGARRLAGAAREGAREAGAARRRARSPTTSTTCARAWRASDPRPRPHRPRRAAHPQARREPALLRAGARHGGRGARGAVGLPARLGRLPALQPQADRVRPGRPRAHGACAPGAPTRSSGGSRRSRPTGLGQGWIDGDLGHGPAYRFTDPDGHAFELYFETEKYTPARAPAAVAEEPAAALRRPRRGGQAARPRERAGARRGGQPRLRRRTCSASGSTSASSSTTAPRPAPG